MKRTLIVLSLLLMLKPAFSQRVYFVYLQSENNLPFSVKMGSTLHYASPAGYLILPQLKDSTYGLSVNFPGDSPGELRFSIPMKGKDHGFLIRDFGARGWGLYDLQTSAVIMAQSDPLKSGIITEPREVSEFTRILAKAADDPSLLVRQVLPQQVALKEEVKPATQVAKTETETPKKIPAETENLAKAPATIATSPGNEPRVDTKQEVEMKETVKTPPVVEKPFGNGNPEGPARAPVTDTANTGSARNSEPGVKKEEEAKLVKKSPEAGNVSTEILEKENRAIVDTANAGLASTNNQDKQGSKEPVKKPVKEDEIVKTGKVAEEKKVEQNDPVTPVLKVEGGGDKAGDRPYKRSIVTRRSESSTTEGFGLTFTDEYSDGKIDTIRIIIPTPKYTLARNIAMEKDERKFLDISSDGGGEKSKAGSDSLVPRKNSCRDIASENDFLRLRKRMAGERSDDGMIGEARRLFRTKCFTVEQIRNLSTLFLEDGGRYRFFDASYTHVSDLENFPTLEQELKDEYYLGRFREVLK